MHVNMTFVVLFLVYQCNLSLTETCISQKVTTFGQPDPGVPLVGKYLKLFPKTTLRSTVDRTRHNPYSQSQDCGWQQPTKILDVALVTWMGLMGYNFAWLVRAHNKKGLLSNFKRYHSRNLRSFSPNYAAFVSLRRHTNQTPHYCLQIL